jgi:mRNA interferase RelE/StbE
MERVIIWTEEAARQLLALPLRVRDRIENKLTALAMDPAAHRNEIKMLKGSRLLRLRVCDCRVIFSDEGVVLAIIRIGHRREVYR